jgi:RNA polymerase sigma factor (sigma-70 family)
MPALRPDEESPDPQDLGATAELFRRARAGDESALNSIYKRFWGVLCRVAHGRLPKCARGLTDTQDVVQNAMVNALKSVRNFEPNHPGAFFAYMHKCVINEIHTQVRKANRRPTSEPIPENLVSGGPSPIELAIGADTHDRYEQALDMLDEDDREVIIAYVEMGFTYADLSVDLGIQPNAARMRVARALLRLAEAMKRLGHGS